jgi:pimeloyl-ACP methyl ester carboxylesterase
MQVFRRRIGRDSVVNQATLRQILFASCLFLGAFCLNFAAAADDEETPLIPEDQAKEETARQKFALKTLGGRQFWGDVHFFHGWRIQKNALTGHFRLLDPKDYRHATGSRKECDDELRRFTETLKLKPMTGKVVMLVHGIIRSSKSFNALAARLKKDGYTVVGFDYPSTRTDIRDSAEYLHSVIESLDKVDEINFVVHSMGGIVVRSYLDKHTDKRIKRMVMMGVPNGGANMADRMRKNSLYRLIYGPAGQQLGSDPDGLIAKLPTPKFEFAIIAGGRNSLTGYNPLVPGDDDGTVSVTSARLPGAADFLLVPCIHSFLMKNDTVIDSTVRFLESGQLRKEGDPHPIPASLKKDGPINEAANKDAE